MKIVWTSLARRRAAEAILWIAKDRPNKALSWRDELLSVVASLNRYANRGRVVSEIGRDEYREVLHRPYRVIYRVEPSRVVVMTIRHQRRAWDPADIPSGSGRPE